MTVRLFLVAPAAIDAALLLACASAAAAAGDCASILVGDQISKGDVRSLQDLGLAVILNTNDISIVHALAADGAQLSSTESLKDVRNALKDLSFGFMPGVSRHVAMEAAEAGVDYVAFTQTKQVAGEPIIGWWQDVTEIPAVAFDPVRDAALKSQRPDFIRPSDDMWHAPERATQIVSKLMDDWSA